MCTSYLNAQRNILLSILSLHNTYCILSNLFSICHNVISQWLSDDITYTLKLAHWRNNTFLSKEEKNMTRWQFFLIHFVINFYIVLTFFLLLSISILFSVYTTFDACFQNLINIQDKLSKRQFFSILSR